MFARSTLVGSLTLCAALLAPEATAGPNPGKDFRNAVKDRLGTLKDDLRNRDKQFADELSTLGQDVAAGTVTPADAHDQLAALLDGLHADMAALQKAFTDGVEADGSAELEQIQVFPKGFVVGDGGTVDDGLRRARKLVAKSMSAQARALRGFSRALKKRGKYDLVLDRRGQAFEPVTPTGSGTPAGDPMTPLRIDILLGCSDLLLTDDGRLSLAGTADADNGATVDVTIELPGVASLNDTATVDPATNRWSVDFADLGEGNYAVSVTQGGVTISDSIGVH